MSEYDDRLVRIASDVSDARDEYHLTTVGYTKVKKPVAPKSHWGMGDAWIDSAVIGVEELRAALNPPTPPSFNPRTNWQRKPWNLDATTQPLDPNSDALIATWLEPIRANLNWPNLTMNDWSQAWTFGRATDPKHDITTTQWPKGKVVKAVPIPDNVKFPPGDGHLTIFDLEGKREIACWAMKYEGGVYTAGSADVIPLGEDPKAPQGSNAAGFPALALAIWPEEIQAGVINHALGFSVRLAATKPNLFRYPAIKTDGGGKADDLPEGAWLALPTAAFFSAAWPWWVRVAWTALYQHGMLLMDQGGTLAVAGVNPINGGVQWSDVGMGTGPTVGFPADFPWAEMRVLAAPS